MLSVVGAVGPDGTPWRGLPITESVGNHGGGEGNGNV